MKPGKSIFGHIDCPTCGTKGGMRITADKNGDPFGYCEAECGQQLRIGGDKARVQKFLSRFPWAQKSEVEVVDPVAKIEAVQEPKPVPKQRSMGVFDALMKG